MTTTPEQGKGPSVQRWSSSLGHTVDGVQIYNDRDDSGDWVRYDDHAAQLAAKDQQIAALLAARKAWLKVHNAKDNGFHHMDAAEAADAACKALGLEIE